jgi:hypothetical protein
MRTVVGTSNPDAGAFGSVRRMRTRSCALESVFPAGASSSFAVSGLITRVGTVSFWNRGKYE